MYTPVNPFYYKKKWGLRASKLYRRVFVMSAQNIDCSYALEPPRFLSRIKKKNNVDPLKPQIYIIKVGFTGFKII